jgi:uncharacterized protein with HEPN domain
MAEAIRQIEILLDGKTFADVEANRGTLAAFERFIEIISEASRHVPPAMQDETPQIPGFGCAQLEMSSGIPMTG